MDCDDQIRLVKRNYDPHPSTFNVPGVSRSSLFVPIDQNRVRNHPFSIEQARSEVPQSVLGMPRESHAPLRIWRAKPFPLVGDIRCQRRLKSDPFLPV
jgi:hypothetical protein